LCSPQNPTGTVFTKKGLEDICDLILEENKRRGDNEKPVYLMYDQIYWELTMEGTTHYNPVVLRPEMRDYTIFVDGLSKSLSATGVRLGWCFGPQKVIDKMKSINTHVGAWAAKAEQIAFANYIKDLESYSKFIEEQKQKIYTRLNGVYQGFEKLKEDGYPVFAIAPQAAIYLTIQLDLIGKTTAEGKVLAETKDVTDYILKEGKLAVVPFSSFGADANSTWYRLSIGTLKVEDIDDIIECLRKALGNLN
ncbi:MAG TPA: aminotransferase class I/II-fold pyridoxal phosphate-dependent enzyme, partial [Brumimicrobium sp.]|nr:aminotransferase class I/II-fold pyridoxal phosphate-dependent enzyme [Brumimicrobium sp.]